MFMPEHLIRDEEGNITKREDVTLVTEDYSVKTQGTTLDKKLTEITDEINGKWDKDELELGGRNLLIDSGFNNGTGDIHVMSHHGEIAIQDSTLIYTSATDLTTQRFEIIKNLPAGDFIVSMYIKNTNSVVDFYNHNNAESDRIRIDTNLEFTKVFFKFTVREKGKVTLRFYLPDMNPEDKLFILQPKLEKGSIATPWIPAPEDFGGIQTQPAPLANMAHIEYLENQIKELREMIALRGLSR